MVCGNMSFIVFVGHASSTKLTKFSRLIDGALLSIRAKIGEPWCTHTRRFPWGVKILKGVNKFVTLFSYIFWPTAMKFGMMRGICAKQVISYFDELWSTFPEAQITKLAAKIISFHFRRRSVQP